MHEAEFNRTVDESKPAVAAIKEQFEAMNYEVTDVQDDKAYQDKDIDLVLVGANDEFVEVKCDRYLEGELIKLQEKGVARHDMTDNLNIYVEVISNIGKRKLGWYYGSKADYIYYVHYRKGDTSICHAFKLDELKLWVGLNNPKLLKHYDKKDRKWKRMYLVPISVIEKFESYERINLEVA